jgi:hypothetical protein
MQGDDRKRLCSGCSRHVFNISDMTRSEANHFLAENGTTQCMIFYRRQDGTIMTDNCPVGLRKLRDQAKALARAAAAVMAFALSWTTAFAQSSDTARGAKKPTDSRARMLGEPAAIPPAGFKYQGNPAGGGFILVPTTKPDGKVISTDGKVKVDPQPVQALPGQVVIQPTNPQPERILMGKPVMKHEPVVTGTNTGSGAVKLHAEKHVYIDKTALESFEKGKAALAEGKNSLAEYHFEKALEACDKQPRHDAKFRELIEGMLKKCRGQCQ